MLNDTTIYETFRMPLRKAQLCIYLDSLPLISLKNLWKNGAKKLVWAAVAPSCTVAYNAFYNELPGLPYIL